VHHRWNLSTFSFSCAHPSPTSSWTALRQWGAHVVYFAPIWILATAKCKKVYLPPL
jgi:hypothetical protein